MTTPEIRHRDSCTDPTVRESSVPLDRQRTRWRCLCCGVEATVTGGHHLRRFTTVDGFEAACSCGWRTCRRTRELRDRDADAHEIGSAR